MTTCVVNGQTFNLAYDAENRLVSVSGAPTADFAYDADGKQVKSVVDGATTYYVNQGYEVKDSVVTKYYFAGATRLAERQGSTLYYLLADHIGSTSVITDANGAITNQALYKAFGDTRYALGALPTNYKFTGQREEASLGLYFFNARWFDPSLGRFTQPDTIVPASTQGTQAWDRYAFVNNNPVRYNDPTGHRLTDGNQFGDGGGDYTWEDKANDAYVTQHSEQAKCDAGNKDYCSEAQKHPVETATFFITSLVAAPLAEYYALEGGLAALLDSAYTSAGIACLQSSLCRWLVGAAGGAGAKLTSNQIGQNGVDQVLKTLNDPSARTEQTFTANGLTGRFDIVTDTTLN